MSTYIRSHVTRSTRNLLVLNGIVLLLSVLFVAFIATGLAILQRMQDRSLADLETVRGGDVVRPQAAVDLSHPTSLRAAEVSEGRLASLEGKAVKLDAPTAVNTMFPVARWMERATGKKQPSQPPNYFVLQTASAESAGGPVPGGPPPGLSMPGMIDPRGGPSFVIIPSQAILPGRHANLTFTGVIRQLQPTDRSTVEGLLRSHGVQAPPLPFVLDCLDVGASRGLPPIARPPSGFAIGRPSPGLFLVALLIALCFWNVAKGILRLKDPRRHPAYERLARYGNALDMERQIDADRKRGSQKFGPAEITPSWLLVPSLWGVDAVPLDSIVWIYRPQKVRRVRFSTITNFIIEYTLILLDRTGKQHVVRSSPFMLNTILATVIQGRPWIETGDPNPLRLNYGMNKAGFIATVEARRAQMTGQAPPPVP